MTLDQSLSQPWRCKKVKTSYKHQTENGSCTFAVIPPESGSRDITRDEEQYDGQVNQVLEPEGPLEAAYESSSDCCCDNERSECGGEKSRWRHIQL